MKKKIYITIYPVDGSIQAAGVDVFHSKKVAMEFASKFPGITVVEKTLYFDDPKPRKSTKRKSVPVRVTCYNDTETYPSAEAAIKFYQEAANCSDGCERDRYLTIVSKLLDGQTDVDDQWG